MFDLSFWEITVIAIVALLVVGPERLPALAYKAGQWVSKVRRFVANARAEMESEFNTAELRKLLTAQEEEMQKLRRLVEETRQEVEDEGRRLTQALEGGPEGTVKASLPDGRAKQDAPNASPRPQGGAEAMEGRGVQGQDAPTAPKTVDDEIQALSQELGESLQRPDFGAGRVPEPETPSSQASGKHER